MGLTPQLLKCMSPGHAIASLRCEMPSEFMPLLDMVEALQPTAEEAAILSAWEGTPDSAVGMDALADAVERIGGVAEACAVLKQVRDFDLYAADVSRALTMADRLEQEGVTTLEKLNTLLDAVRGLP